MAEHRFELIGRVALTATSTVWKARDVGLDRVVALKQLHSADPVLRQRWRDEAHALGSLDERHVVSVYGLYEDPDSAWLIEQWIDGATLATVVRSAGPLSPEQGVGVVRGALLGLAHAHGRGIIHRDLSLSNIMLDQWGESVLIDFGLAAPPGEHGSSGTAAFQSPEARAGQPITERSDIYSMGAILGHLLAGSSETPRGLERPMREVIERAMTTDPAGRFASAQELLSALEQAAKQTYGPAWLLQASVVGLVSGVSAAELLAPATGGAAVPGVGVSLTDAPGAAEPEAPPPGDAWPGAVESGPLVSAPVTEARRERPRLPRRRLLAGGGAAAVIAVIVVASSSAAAAATTSRGRSRTHRRAHDAAPVADTDDVEQFRLGGGPAQRHLQRARAAGHLQQLRRRLADRHLDDPGAVRHVRLYRAFQRPTGRRPDVQLRRSAVDQHYGRRLQLPRRQQTHRPRQRAHRPCPGRADRGRSDRHAHRHADDHHHRR